MNQTAAQGAERRDLHLISMAPLSLLHCLALGWV